MFEVLRLTTHTHPVVSKLHTPGLPHNISLKLVAEQCSIFRQLVAYQVVHKSSTLDTQGLDCLKHIHHLLRLHAIQNVIQGAERARST